MVKGFSYDDILDMQGQQVPETAQEQLKSQLSLRHSSFKADDTLFLTPQDLLCPITLSLFQDPVINGMHWAAISSMDLHAGGNCPALFPPQQ